MGFFLILTMTAKNINIKLFISFDVSSTPITVINVDSYDHRQHVKMNCIVGPPVGIVNRNTQKYKHKVVHQH